MKQLLLLLGLTLISCLLGLTTAHPPRVDDLLVNTNYGYVLGSLEYSRNSREFASFRGIPYAQPPVGDLRFQNPQPPNIWNSPYNATVNAPLCLQTQSSLIVGQEDCLYLNIYVPIIENESNDLLPVMTFIHGGGFRSGGSASNMYGPKYLMDKDVILVTLNYRLGALGTLSTLDDEAPGNFALKDQVMALRFVNENIVYFGGDQDRVTIFGESAGGRSVGVQLISPLSNGLFQQAIGQSGSALAAWSVDNNERQLKATNSLASVVGCEDFIGDSKRLTQCLRRLDAETIIAAEGLVDSSFGPCVAEIKTDRNSEPFLEKSPAEYIEAGEFKKIPFIIGSNQDEGCLPVAPLLKVNETREMFNANFDVLLPSLLALQPGIGGDIEMVLKNLTDFYLEGDHFIDVNDPTKTQGFINMATDRMVYPANQIVILQYLNGHESIWSYNFAYRGNHSYGDFSGPSDINFNWGVTHGDEMQYLFESVDYLAPSGLDGFDLKVSEDLVSLWTNFAIFGNPDPNGDFSWSNVNFGSNVSNENLNYLNITGSFASESFSYQAEVGYRVDRMQLWAELNVA